MTQFPQPRHASSSVSNIEVSVGQGACPDKLLFEGLLSFHLWNDGRLLDGDGSHRAGLLASPAVDAGIFAMGDLLDDLARPPFLIEEGVGGTGVNAGSAGLADFVVSEEIPLKRLLKSYGSDGADRGAPTAVDAAIQINHGLAAHLKAAVARKISIFYLDAAFGADLDTQATVNAFLVYGSGLHGHMQVRVVHLRSCRPS